MRENTEDRRRIQGIEGGYREYMRENTEDRRRISK